MQTHGKNVEVYIKLITIACQGIPNDIKSPNHALFISVLKKYILLNDRAAI